MNLKNIALWLFIGLIIIGLFNLFNPNASNTANTLDLTYSQFLENVKNGSVNDVTIRGNNVSGNFSDGRKFKTYAVNDPTLVEKLTNMGVNISAAPLDDGFSILGILISWFPMLLLIGVWVFFMRQMQGGKGGAMGFGKSKAKLLNENKNKITFNDVAGVDESKEELVEIVEFLKDPRKFQKLGGRIPKGALLVGSPGTGKTLLARAVAGEANVPFFSISGSDFVEMFVGVGASRVRDMFEQGRKHAPCIIFIDEIDAVGRSRGAGLGGGNDEREQTLNQILVEMDGFDAQEGVIIIAATNRPDVLDPALLRPGRFDRQIVVPSPDLVGREAILKVHMKKITFAPDVNIRTVARGTPGFSGADLANLVNESALLAARKNKKIVTMIDFEESRDKVAFGTERRSAVMTEDEIKLTAYHEAGHALCSLNLPAHPIHKATIIPRGRALGMVMYLPEKDIISVTREEYEARMVSALGGRVAEEIIFGRDKVTSGASSDIQQVTKTAREMVTQFGMSETLGPILYAENDEEVFLGRSVQKHKNVSEETAKTIDSEIKKLVDESYEKTKQILNTKIDDLHTLAKGLIEYETLELAEIKELLKTGTINRANPEDEIKNAGPSVPKSGKSKPTVNPDLKPKPQTS